MAQERTDTERLDWLQAQSTDYGGWKARMSEHGRGYRLHQTHRLDSEKTVREAIDAAMDESSKVVIDADRT